jgi:hypothetical protein
MDWNMILGFLFGGTGIGGLITGVFFFRENRQLKRNEVKSSNADVEGKEIDNDDKQIDLGKKYLENTLEITQRMQEMMLNSNKEREEYWAKQKETMNELRGLVGNLNDKVDNLDKRVTKLDNQVVSLTEEVGQVSGFLNGDFADWKRKRKKQVPKSRKAADNKKAVETNVKKADE